MPVDVGLYVRLTAWASSAVFTGSLVAFVVNVRRTGRPSAGTRRAFLAFIAAHTVHFLTVLWLAQVTGGRNVRDAGGWVSSLVVAALFYAGSCAILPLWRRRAAGEDAPRRLTVLSHVAVVVITAIFLSSYIVRALTSPAYAIPVLVMTSVVLVYLRSAGWRGAPSGAGPWPAVYADAGADVFRRQRAEKRPPFV